MNLILHKAPLFIAALVMLSSAGVYAAEPAESTTGTAPGVAVKVEKAVEHGAKAAAGGVERGAKAAASGVERGAKAAASGVERGAKAAARGIKRGAKAAAGGVERGAKATGNAAHSVAKKVEGSPTPPPSPDK